MYREHTQCRACGYARTGSGGSKRVVTESLIPVFDLGLQPLANDFRKSGEECSGYAPLKVMLCPRCSLAQLSVVVNPHILYDRYSYVTSPSQTMADHFATLTRDLMAEAPDAKSVLEIGSNDGTLLTHFQSMGLRAEGIDPAENLGKIAAEKGVLTTLGMFGEKTASTLGKFDLVVARHVFCHVDDWKDFVKGLEAVSLHDTLIAIETPYVQDLLDKCEFDTIYHEHLSYLNLKSVVALLKDTSLRLHGIIRYPIHGGAIVMIIDSKDSGNMPHPSVQQFLDAEDMDVASWKRFGTNAGVLSLALKQVVGECNAKGRVAALGASAKSTVWINACGFTRKDIAFIADTTPQKWYTNSPGSDIAIVDEGAILRELPDYVVCFCWNFRSEVLEKFKLAREKGVRFIFPVPVVEIV